jgi:hypothetical protein
MFILLPIDLCDLGAAALIPYTSPTLPDSIGLYCLQAFTGKSSI